MADPEGLSRQELYANWLAWATKNLGASPTQAAAAANAAADTAAHGDGFNAAAIAARAAFFKAGLGEGTQWRPGFWALFVLNPSVWAVPVALLLLVMGTVVWASDKVLGPVLITVPIAVGVVGWQVGYALLLSSRGEAAAGSLLKVKELRGGRGGRSWLATYQFELQGRQYTASHQYLIEDSIRNDVVVLFYPRLLMFAKVLPEILNPDN